MCTVNQDAVNTGAPAPVSGVAKVLDNFVNLFNSHGLGRIGLLAGEGRPLARRAIHTVVKIS